MSEPVIQVENLSKVYNISHKGARPDTFRDTLSGLFKNLATRNSQPATEREAFYALRDVSFEVKQGEVLGIIGKNGAGKSTLLKILSRITEPTTGRITLKGRVASLLEVGTGFHPELTGRENIFLNGAILGMSRQEIRSKFDEIVDFAGVEKFLDTPVKRYSSGMYVRLAFSVAAHIRPEILIIDEVLAVGDAEFQRRCLGKMKDVASQGRTVLFVSHNLSMIEALCNRCILLNKGIINDCGRPDHVMQSYSHNQLESEDIDLDSYSPREGRGNIRFKRMKLAEAPRTGGRFQFVLFLTKEIESNTSRCSVLFSNLQHQPVAVFSSELTGDTVQYKYKSALRCEIPRLPLAPGLYLISVYLEVDRTIEDWLEYAFTLSVEEGAFHSTGNNLPQGWNKQMTLVDHKWSAVQPAAYQ